MATVGSSLPVLPERLMRFFARYPPTKYSAYATGQHIPTIKRRIEASITTESPSIDPDLSMHNDTTTESISPAPAIAETSTTTAQKTKKSPSNPFLPRKNHVTGRWSGARIGLRIQADLFKLARQHGVEELLPPSIKSTEYKHRRILERGLQVKGTGEGQRVKGHKWERQKASVMEKRRKAMEEMPELIRVWKQTGHGRGWKKYPR